MREILFRGKDKKTGRWAEGQYAFTNWSGKKRHYIIPKVATDFFIPSFKQDGFYGVEVDDETVGEYTGFTDKNGNKIFEDDIVRYNPHKACEMVGYIIRNKHRPEFYIWSDDNSYDLENYLDGAEVIENSIMRDLFIVINAIKKKEKTNNES